MDTVGEGEGRPTEKTESTCMHYPVSNGERTRSCCVDTGRPAWHSVITSLSFNDVYNVFLVFAAQSPSVQCPSLTVKTLASPPRDI